MLQKAFGPVDTLLMDWPDVRLAMKYITGFVNLGEMEFFWN